MAGLFHSTSIVGTWIAAWVGLLGHVQGTASHGPGSRGCGQGEPFRKRRVTVSYRVDGPRIRITVADTGSGIEPEKVARLFLPFERLGAESTDIEGAGIGGTGPVELLSARPSNPPPRFA